MARKRKLYSWEKAYPEGVLWDSKIESAPLFTLLDTSAGVYSRHTALNFYGKCYSYAELGTQVNQLAKGLQKNGLKKGDKVGLLMPNCPYYVIAFFAILKVGGIVVNLNPLYTISELKHFVQSVKVKMLMTINHKKLHEKTNNLMRTTGIESVVIARLEAALPFPKNYLFRWSKKDELAVVSYSRAVIDFDTLLDNDGLYKPVEIDPEKDIAVLQFTGGTTGVSKAAMLSHANLYANTQQCALWFNALERGQEKICAVLPFFHIFSLTAVMNLGIAMGAEIVIHSKFQVEELIEDIVRRKITVLPGVPSLFAAINAHVKSKPSCFATLKYAISGGAPLPLKVKEKFEALSSCRLVEGYGLSECSPVVTVNPLKGKVPVGSVGLPLPHTQVEVRPVKGQKEGTYKKGVGEICVKGPQVMLGYSQPEKGEKLIRSGYLGTGDIGYIDKNGYVFIVDRLKEMIIVNGYNVYSREVEDAVALHAAVDEVAVIGIPDEHRGQRVKACIKLKAGEELSKIKLLKFLEGKLAKYKLPMDIEFREDLPRTLIGKVDKKILVKEG